MKTVFVHSHQSPNSGSRFDYTAIDAAWNRSRVADNENAKEVTIDLSRVTYLEHNCLLFLIGLISHRQARGLETCINLPHKERVLDYLNAWRVPEAVTVVTGKEFPDLLTTQSKSRYAKVRELPSRYITVATDSTGGRESLLPISYFSLTPIEIKNNWSNAPSAARSKWLDQHIVSVLNKHLKGYGDRVATDIIHEGLLNAISHPRATLAYTSAQATQQSAKYGRSSELEIGIWDNGDSFTSTLGKTLREYHTIRSRAFGLVPEVFTVKVLESGRPDRTLALTSKDRAISAAPELLMASAFMLGITSIIEPQVDIERSSTHLELPQSVLPHEARGHGGIGLYLIRKTVVDLFGGRITYINNQNRMTLNASDRPNTYDVTVQKLGGHSCPIKGNLLIATLPLRQA